ncbi:MAG: LytR/AlgR family response regulator transcription factor [Lentimicrobium sp.]
MTTTASNSTKIRTLIIDDEAYVRKSIASLITHFCSNVHLVGEADGVKTGLSAIRNHHPDLVLLDIKMGDGSGFDLLNQLETIDFRVIFVTAYEQFAVKAFKYSAVDYLLKPVDPEDLVQAVERVSKLLLTEQQFNLRALESNLNSQDLSGKKIVVKTLESIYLVNQCDLLYCESDGSYTTLTLRNGQTILTSKSLKEFDDMLSMGGFYRLHKSYLINLSAIERFDRSEGGYIILNGGHKIPVASRKRDDLMKMIDSME